MSNDANRSHVLLTLGILFTLGGATRLLPVSFASAETTGSTAPAPASRTDAKPDGKTGASAVAEKAAPGKSGAPVCFTGETAEKMNEDRWLFESEQDALDQEKIALLARKAELEEQSALLAARQKTVETRWQEMQQEAGADIDHLARMYGAMKPDQAASIFNQMDGAFAAGFLRRLSSDQAGLILASMEPSKAYVVSVKLASRNDDLRQSSAGQAEP